MGVTHEADLVVAVDGGGSKTDVAVVGRDGVVRGRHRGPGCSQHELGPDRAAQVIDMCVAAALQDAGSAAARVAHAGCYLTAIDLPDEQVAMTELLARTPWGARSLTVDNDLFALLRAGTSEIPAAVVVCGTGINGLAIADDGTTARLVALGRCSGDWGGGADLVEEALWCAARAEDGRGEPTELRDAVLRWAEASCIDDVSVAVHRGHVDPGEWIGHVPEVFALAAAGDTVARELVVRQGREIGLIAASLLERRGLQDRDLPVVLGGGIGACGDPILESAVVEVLRARAPHARLTVTASEPIEGAIRLALERPGSRAENGP